MCIAKVPLTDLRAVNNDYLFQKWFSNCRKTGVYASVLCELNTAEVVHIPQKSQSSTF